MYLLFIYIKIDILKWALIIAVIVNLILAFWIFKFKKIYKNQLLNQDILWELANSSRNLVIRYSVKDGFDLTHISANVERFLGYNCDFFLKNKNHYHNLINPCDIVRLKNTHRALTTAKKKYTIDYRIKTQKGDEKWIREIGSGLFDKRNNLTEVEGIIEDISEVKLNEFYLNEYENRFGNLIGNSPFGICIICEHLITYCNQALVNILGFSSGKELIGTSLFSYVAPSDRKKLKRIIDNFLDEKTEIQELESIAVSKNGEEKNIQMYFSKVILRDLICIFVSVQDITPIKKNEKLLRDLNERLENIIDLIPDPIFIIDKQKEVTHWNKAMENLTGAKKTDIVGSNKYSRIFYGEERPMLIDLAIDDSYITTSYKNLKKINNKLYGDFSGKIKNSDKEVYLTGVGALLHDNDENLFGAIEVIKDVTENKKKEIALLESEEKARIILDRSNDSIVMSESDGTIIDCNTAFARSFEKEKSELLNKSYLNLLPEPKRLAREMHFRAIKEKGIELTFEEFNVSSDEYYLTSIYPVKGTPAMKRIIISTKNITKLIKAELETKKKEEYYRTITENITDYVYTLRVDKGKFSIQHESPGVEKVLGYKASELTFDLILEKIIPYEQRQKALSLLNVLFRERINLNEEYQIIDKSGQKKWVSNSLIIRSASQDSLEAIGVVKDITLQKQLGMALLEAEERYRSVFDQSGLASNVYDLSGKLIMQNLLASELIGGVPSDFIGRNIDELYSTNVSSLIKELFSETLSKGPVNKEAEFRILNKSVWLRIFTHSVKNMNGEVVGIQFISQDISEKKEMDKKVMNIILETEEKERRNFAQELHDGVGPLLSAVKMYIQWLRMPVVNTSKEEILADIEKTVDESLLAIKEVSYKLNPGNLVKLGLTEALKEFACKIDSLGKTRIVIESNLSQRMEIRKETILYRVLCESISNTIKYANASEILISIKVTDDKLRIKYTDNGVGFDVHSVMKMNKGSGIKNIKNRLDSIDAAVLFKSAPEEGIEIIIDTNLT